MCAADHKTPAQAPKACHNRRIFFPKPVAGLRRLYPYVSMTEIVELIPSVDDCTCAAACLWSSLWALARLEHTTPGKRWGVSPLLPITVMLDALSDVSWYRCVRSYSCDVHTVVIFLRFHKNNGQTRPNWAWYGKELPIIVPLINGQKSMYFALGWLWVLHGLKLSKGIKIWTRIKSGLYVPFILVVLKEKCERE